MFLVHTKVGNLGSSIRTVDGTEYSHYRRYECKVNTDIAGHDHSPNSPCALRDSCDLRERWRCITQGRPNREADFQQAIPSLPGKSLVAVEVQYRLRAASVPHVHASPLSFPRAWYQAQSSQR
jgi:hypothetical protein